MIPFRLGQTEACDASGDDCETPGLVHRGNSRIRHSSRAVSGLWPIDARQIDEPGNGCTERSIAAIANRFSKSCAGRGTNLECPSGRAGASASSRSLRRANSARSANRIGDTTGDGRTTSRRFGPQPRHGGCRAFGTTHSPNHSAGLAKHHEDGDSNDHATPAAAQH